MKDFFMRSTFKLDAALNLAERRAIATTLDQFVVHSAGPPEDFIIKTVPPTRSHYRVNAAGQARWIDVPGPSSHPHRRLAASDDEMVQPVNEFED